MKLLRQLWYFLTAARRDRELREELELHRRDLRDNFEQSGMSAQQAAVESRRRLGNTTLAREDARDVWVGRLIGTVGQDARYTFRTFRRNPIFAALALLILAFGIGAATAIFSVVYAIVLKPLAYGQPGSLVAIRAATESSLTLQQLDAVVTQSHAFTGVATGRLEMSTTHGQDGPAHVPDYACTLNLFDVLGVRAQIGRVFGARDADRRVVVLAHDWWTEQFGADPGVVGRTITLDDTPYEIVGVMPAEFRFPYVRSARLWIPADAAARKHTERLGVWVTVARLRADASMASARAELALISSRLAGDPAYAKRPLVVVPMIDAVLGGPVKSRLFVLLAAVGLVLLIACANVASLFLTRSRARARELAVRAAVGAGRRRLVRQLLTEALVIGLLAGALGLVLARWTLAAVIGLIPSAIPRADAIRIDGVVLLYACFLSILSGAAAGLLPALRVGRGNWHDELKNGQPLTAPAGTIRTGAAFVFAETSLAVVLLVGAALMIRSFDLLTRIRPGFDASHTVAVSLKTHPSPAALQDLVNRARRLPGVREVSGADSFPFLRFTMFSDLEVQGRPRTPFDLSNVVNEQRLLPGYFHLLGIPLVRGREFTDRDVNGAPMVAVINEAVVRRYFPAEDPFGLRIYGQDGWYQIVGVVKDVKWKSLADEAPAAVYFPALQGTVWQNLGDSLLLRMDPSVPSSLAELKAEATNVLGPVAPVLEVRSIDAGIAASVQQWKFQAVLLGIFGALALILAIAGIIGVTSYAVLQRTREIGVRLALGAQRSQMLALVIKGTARPVVAGLAVGLGAAVLATRTLAAFLFQITPTDPPTYAATAVVFLAAALTAAAIPAYQATRVDPAITLRQE